MKFIQNIQPERLQGNAAGEAGRCPGVRGSRRYIAARIWWRGARARPRPPPPRLTLLLLLPVLMPWKLNINIVAVSVCLHVLYLRLRFKGDLKIVVSLLLNYTERIIITSDRLVVTFLFITRHRVRTYP